MVSINLLEHFLLSQLTAFLLILCRVGAALMMMPIYGDSYVSPRLRLLFAGALSVLLTPLLMSKIPGLPVSVFALGLLIVSEIIIGTFIGLISRTILSVMHTAGTVVAYQSSLAMSSIFDPVTGTQTAVLSNFFTITAVTLMLSLNLHHYMLAGVVESYTLFTPGAYPMIEDMMQYQVRLISDAFTLGLMLAAPHIIFSFIFYLMGGLMARLMPNFQTFYVMMPPQIIIAFILIFSILGVAMQVFGDFAQEHLVAFTEGSF